MSNNEERIRRFVNKQMAKIKRISGVGSLILLVINLSFSVYAYIEYRGIHIYIALPLLVLLMGSILLLVAHFYTLHMYRTEAEAEKYFNPYATYAIGPFEEITYRFIYLPMMKALLSTMDDEIEKKVFKEKIDIWERWINLGYIPKDEYPKHLLKFYITNKEARL